jgi:hypothetical protein
MVRTDNTTTVITEERPARSFVSATLHILRLAVVNFAIFAVLAELLCVGIVHWKKWPSRRPSYHLESNTIFTDADPAFGNWHRLNDHYLLQEGCFAVGYDTNSYGARDVERSLHSAQPRTIVLGDSFMEGWGLPVNERLSNLLEQRTGIEHLNFGDGGGFSPLQYALVYRALASKFDHTDVLVGVLPDNDFHEMDGPWLSQKYPGQYRPYYKSDYSIGYLGHLTSDTSEGFWDRVEAALRAYLASYHVGQYIYASTLDRPFRSPYSGFNDYSDVDLERLKHALLDIKSTADAHGAKVHVILIPRYMDFERLHQTGSNRLGPVMESWGQSVGIPIKDLLPEMEARSNGNDRSYFLTCDGHWSERGSMTAADILEPWIYGK